MSLNFVLTNPYEPCVFISSCLLQRPASSPLPFPQAFFSLPLGGAIHVALAVVTHTCQVLRFRRSHYGFLDKLITKGRSTKILRFYAGLRIKKIGNHLIAFGVLLDERMGLSQYRWPTYIVPLCFCSSESIDPAANIVPLCFWRSESIPLCFGGYGLAGSADNSSVAHVNNGYPRNNGQSRANTDWLSVLSFKCVTRSVHKI